MNEEVGEDFREDTKKKLVGIEKVEMGSKKM